MHVYLNKILIKWQFDFREEYDTHHYFLIKTDKWSPFWIRERMSGALLTDLSKAFDCFCMIF